MDIVWILNIALVVMLFGILMYGRRFLIVRKANEVYQSIVQRSGIVAFWSRASDGPGSDVWTDCAAKISESPDGEMSLLLITGDDLVNTPQRRSPLREALDRYSGDVRVLLMEKDGWAWDLYVKEQGWRDHEREARFRRELERDHDSAVEFLQRLATRPTSTLRSIEVREYDHLPLWKLVLMNKHLWVQHYVPGQPLDDSPAYCLRRGVKSGMASSVERLFEHYWNSDTRAVVVPRRALGAQSSAFATIAEQEARSSRRALRLSLLYAGFGVILLLVGLGAPFVPVSNLEERLFGNTSLPIYMILRTLGFIGAILTAGWFLRMHHLAINRYWLHEEQEIEALRFLGDVLPLSDHERPEDVRKHLEDYRAMAAQISVAHRVESQEVGGGVIDRLFDLASSTMGRRKKQG